MRRVDHRAVQDATGSGRATLRATLGPALSRFAGWIAALFTAYTVLIVTAVVGAGLVIGLTAAATEVYEGVAAGEDLSALDRPALDRAVAWRTATSTRVISAFTQLGGPVGMTIIASLVTLAMVWRWRSRTPLVLMVIAVAGSLTMTGVGKAIVGRPRPSLDLAVPPYEYAFSFPSGHALNSTVIAGVVAYLLFCRLRTAAGRAAAIVLAVIWAVAMGLSRVFLGHHWVTDVVFAWLLGAAWVGLLITADLLQRAFRARSATGPARA